MDDKDEDIEQIQKDIKQIKEIVTRDHHMMGVLYRYHRWTRAYVLLKILIIAGVIFGAYYYVEPMIEPFVRVYEKVVNSGMSNSSTTPSQAIFNYMKKF